MKTIPKNFVVLIISVMLTIPFILAAPANFPVTISYTDSSTDGKNIVADVPFDVMVLMDTSQNDVLSYNLYVTSTDARATFSSASRGQLFPQNDLDSNSGPQIDNTIYRYQVKPKVGYVGNSADKAVSIFNLRTKIPGTTASTVELKRGGTAIHADNVITPAATGASISAINDMTREITPLLSRCGDGVVGYIESGTADGIRQEATEPEEACDEGSDGTTNQNRNNAAGGCSAQCNYIELGYNCMNTKFGDRGSICSRLLPKEFLIQKLTALINGQCYPDCQHPQALYEDSATANTKEPRLQYIRSADEQEKLTLEQKIYMLGQMGTALSQFFSAVIIPPATTPPAS